MKPMSFKLCHDPEKKTLTIPRAALQFSGLAGAEELVLHTEEGFLLLSRRELSTREAINAFTKLDQLLTLLAKQLVDDSNETACLLEEADDPLDEFDEDTIEALVDCGADPEGLRMLLGVEDAQVKGAF